MSTVKVCDRCDARMPRGSESYSLECIRHLLVGSLVAMEADLCPKCYEELRAFVHGTVGTEGVSEG